MRTRNSICRKRSRAAVVAKQSTYRRSHGSKLGFCSRPWLYHYQGLERDDSKASCAIIEPPTSRGTTPAPMPAAPKQLDFGKTKLPESPVEFRLGPLMSKTEHPCTSGRAMSSSSWWLGVRGRRGGDVCDRRRGRKVGDRPRWVRDVGECGMLSWVFVVVVCVK